MKRKYIEKMTIAGFLGFTGVFSVWNMLAPKKDYSANENRILAAFPELSVSHIFGGKFDDDFETWFSDHFVNRDNWIELKSAVRKNTGSIENNGVYYAADGHLIKQFQTYDQKTLQQNIDSINQFCTEQGIKGRVLLVPTASFAESQLLPIGAWNISQYDLLNKIRDQFADQTFIEVADELSGRDNLYFRTDHHWNEAGAWVAYEAIMNQVIGRDSDRFKFELVSSSFYGTMYSKSGAFWTKPDDIYKFTPKENEFSTCFSWSCSEAVRFWAIVEDVDGKKAVTDYLSVQSWPFYNVMCMDNQNNIPGRMLPDHKQADGKTINDFVNFFSAGMV
ncbi:MAG: hypothetical protein EOM64_07305, partial [Erysipelotrichia bacterium]|nr:hypothetical protein [Erysipelotrichia bacterium]